MKLFLLTPRFPDCKGPWDPWYNKCFKMVIRAENEEAARIIAGYNAHDEGAEVWLSKSFVDCSVLEVDGEEEVVIMDVANA